MTEFNNNDDFNVDTSINQLLGELAFLLKCVSQNDLILEFAEKSDIGQLFYEVEKLTSIALNERNNSSELFFFFK